MTTLINVSGGPGAGKSTFAALVYSGLSVLGKRAELITEIAKEYVWDERKIKITDQLYLLGAQIRRESRVLGKVEFLITDSPAFLSPIYMSLFANKHSSDFSKAMEGIVLEYYKYCKEEGHRIINAHVKRVNEYDPIGRFQNKEQAIALDKHILLTAFYIQGLELRTVFPTKESSDTFIRSSLLL